MDVDGHGYFSDDNNFVDVTKLRKEVSIKLEETREKQNEYEKESSDSVYSCRLMFD